MDRFNTDAIGRNRNTTQITAMILTRTYGAMYSRDHVSRWQDVLAAKVGLLMVLNSMDHNPFNLFHYQFTNYSSLLSLMSNI